VSRKEGRKEGKKEGMISRKKERVVAIVVMACQTYTHSSHVHILIYA
jgi:hypothetical protein